VDERERGDGERERDGGQREKEREIWRSAAKFL
jgi:hypothetical protein